MKLLFIDGCVRGEKSRTKRLCTYYIEHLQGEYEIETVDLAALGLLPLNKETEARRSALEEAGDYSDPMFDLAKQFAAADRILIGAPYWEFSFPSILRVYFEHISVTGITFGYTEKGQTGFCRAGQVMYINTAGGPVGENHIGATFIRALMGMFGIDNVAVVTAEGLDILGADVEGILAEAEKVITEEAAVY